MLELQQLREAYEESGTSAADVCYTEMQLEDAEEDMEDSPPHSFPLFAQGQSNSASSRRGAHPKPTDDDESDNEDDAPLGTSGTKLQGLARNIGVREPICWTEFG